MGETPNNMYVNIHYDFPFVKSIYRILKDGIFTDAVIICADNTFVECHKAVLGTASHFMRELIKGSTQDIIYISLPDVQRQHVDLLLNLLYKGKTYISTNQIKYLKEIIDLLNINIPETVFSSFETLRGLLNIKEKRLKDCETETVFGSVHCENDPLNVPDIYDTNVSGYKEVEPNVTSIIKIEKEELQDEPFQYSENISPWAPETSTGTFYDSLPNSAESQFLFNDTSALPSCVIETPDVQLQNLHCDLPESYESQGDICYVPDFKNFYSEESILQMDKSETSESYLQTKEPETTEQSLQMDKPKISASSKSSSKLQNIDNITLGHNCYSVSKEHNYYRQFPTWETGLGLYEGYDTGFNSDSYSSETTETASETGSCSTHENLLSIKYTYGSGNRRMKKNVSLNSAGQKSGKFGISSSSKDTILNIPGKIKCKSKEMLGLTSFSSASSSSSKKQKRSTAACKTNVKSTSSVSAAEFEIGRTGHAAVSSQISNALKVKILEDFYIKNRHPGIFSCAKLSRELRIPLKKIVFWFSRRKEREHAGKKRVKKEECSSFLKPEQRQILEEAYEKDRTPGVPSYIRLSQELQLPVERVITWFSNRRDRDCTGKKGLKKRVTFNKEQQKILEEAYGNCKMPNVSTYIKLSEEMQVPLERVITWFSRRKDKDYTGGSTWRGYDVILNEELEKALEKMFLENNYSDESQQELSQKLNLPLMFVNRWFKKREAKDVSGNKEGINTAIPSGSMQKQDQCVTADNSCTNAAVTKGLQDEPFISDIGNMTATEIRHNDDEVVTASHLCKTSLLERGNNSKMHTTRSRRKRKRTLVLSKRKRRRRQNLLNTEQCGFMEEEIIEEMCEMDLEKNIGMTTELPEKLSVPSENVEDVLSVSQENDETSERKRRQRQNLLNTKQCGFIKEEIIEMCEMDIEKNLAMTTELPEELSVPSENVEDVLSDSKVNDETNLVQTLEELTKTITAAYRITFLYSTEYILEKFREPVDTNKLLYYKKLSHEKLWLDCAQKLVLVTERIIEFAKMIPGFMALSEDEQILLLKAGIFELSLLRMTRYYDESQNRILYGDTMLPWDPFYCAGGLVIRLVTGIFEFAKEMAELKLTDSELGLYSVYVLLSTDYGKNARLEGLSWIRETVIKALVFELQNNHTAGVNKDVPIYDILNTKLLILRKLSALYRDTLSKFKKSSPHVKFPGLHEEFFQ